MGETAAGARESGLDLPGALVATATALVTLVPRIAHGAAATRTG